MLIKQYFDTCHKCIQYFNVELFTFTGFAIILQLHYFFDYSCMKQNLKLTQAPRGSTIVNVRAYFQLIVRACIYVIENYSFLIAVCCFDMLSCILVGRVGQNFITTTVFHIKKQLCVIHSLF